MRKFMSFSNLFQKAYKFYALHLRKQGKQVCNIIIISHFCFLQNNIRVAIEQIKMYIHFTFKR